MSKPTMLVLTALTAALLVACDGGADSTGAPPTVTTTPGVIARFEDDLDTIIEEMAGRLRQENAQHYTFGCVDVGGTALSGAYSAEAIADDANVGVEHPAASWLVGTTGTSPGGDTPGYITIYDPDSGPTNASGFERREVTSEKGRLICLMP